MDRGNPFSIPSHAAIAAENRARLSADLTGRGASIALALVASAALATATVLFVTRLAEIDAALKCAASV